MNLRETIQYRLNRPASFLDHEDPRVPAIEAAFEAAKDMTEEWAHTAFRVGHDNAADAILAGIMRLHRVEQNNLIGALVAAIGNYALVSGADDRNRHAHQMAKTIRESLTGSFFPRGE